MAAATRWPPSCSTATTTATARSGPSTGGPMADRSGPVCSTMRWWLGPSPRSTTARKPRSRSSTTERGLHRAHHVLHRDLVAADQHVVVLPMHAAVAAARQRGEVLVADRSVHLL